MRHKEQFWASKNCNRKKSASNTDLQKKSNHFCLVPQTIIHYMQQTTTGALPETRPTTTSTESSATSTRWLIEMWRQLDMNYPPVQFLPHIHTILTNTLLTQLLLKLPPWNRNTSSLWMFHGSRKFACFVILEDTKNHKYLQPASVRNIGIKNDKMIILLYVKIKNAGDVFSDTV